MTFRQLAFYEHRNAIFISLATITSALAVRPDSTLLPLVAMLSTLLVYSPFLFRSDQTHRSLNILLTWIALSIGSPLSRIHASLQALSTPGGSIVALFISSAFLSSITLTTLWASTKYHAHSTSSWGQVTLFPAVWSTVWCAVSYVNPVGRLATWSVANNTDAYNWIIPYLGPTSKDWITAAWAVVISQTIGSWYIGFQDFEDEIDLLQPQSNHNQPPTDNIRATRLLALFLTVLTIPSFLLSSLPRPASLSTLDISTPLTVGCALPPYERYKRHVLTLDDYITETRKIGNVARVILWPEGAVTFRSATERDEGLKKVHDSFNRTFIGVSFEEVTDDPSDPTGRQSLIKTGIAVVSSYSKEPHQIYYKRHLVPFAESYRLRHSTLPPTISELQYFKPNRDIKWKDWAPATNNSRPIPITSSVCLDFATPSPFAELDSRPALILAPARTWDLTVGYAMWLQAKQRAEELGTMVLWCDGGEGGVSGVAGNGYGDVSQVGSGSFVRTIGIQYPFDTRQTIFARFGDLVLILFWVSALGPGLLSRRIPSGRYRPIHQRIRSVVQWVRPGQTAQPNLVDL